MKTTSQPEADAQNGTHQVTVMKAHHRITVVKPESTVSSESAEEAGSYWRTARGKKARRNAVRVRQKIVKELTKVEGKLDLVLDLMVARKELLEDLHTSHEQIFHPELPNEEEAQSVVRALAVTDAIISLLNCRFLDGIPTPRPWHHLLFPQPNTH